VVCLRGSVRLIVRLGFIILRLFLANWLRIVADTIGYLLRVRIVLSHQHPARGALTLLLNIGGESRAARVADCILVVAGVVTLLDEVQLLLGDAL